MDFRSLVSHSLSDLRKQERVWIGGHCRLQYCPPALLSTNAYVSTVGLGELCSKTLLLCYAPMLSNDLIMLLRIVIMLMECSLHNIIHEHVVTWW